MSEIFDDEFRREAEQMLEDILGSKLREYKSNPEIISPLKSDKLIINYFNHILDKRMDQINISPPENTSQTNRNNPIDPQILAKLYELSRQAIAAGILAENRQLTQARNEVLTELPYSELVDVATGPTEIGEILYERFAPMVETFKQRKWEQKLLGKVTDETDRQYETALIDYIEFFAKQKTIHDASWQLLGIAQTYPTLEGMDELMKLQFSRMGAITTEQYEVAAQLTEKIAEFKADVVKKIDYLSDRLDSVATH